MVHGGPGARGHHSGTPPCAHNNWKDLRGRKHHKTLMCLDCGVRWQVDIFGRRGGWCVNYYQGSCHRGNACQSLHVRRRAVAGNAQAAPVPPRAPSDADGAGSLSDGSGDSPLFTRGSAPSSPSPGTGAEQPPQQSALPPNGNQLRARRLRTRPSCPPICMTGDTEWCQLEYIWPDEAPWMMTEAQLDNMLCSHGF
eukprot:TRINITY_DN71256_c0_g1_i1.p1 TRINITY_DN71256_c0_g1~~TRINITY_DN71256_c0_g1_i1.p1  ORF type:complete len:196 (+),score=27.75 TRINITY_DN71256_c0_g1_i1:84-671(+)